MRTLALRMVSCSQYDYIEIACLYKLVVKLELENGDTIKGVAKDTLYNDNKEECLLVYSNNKERVIVLSQLVSMQAIEDKTHFDKVSF